MTKHDPKSFKKVAVLTGLTVLVGGAEISSIEAATIVQSPGFFVPENDTRNLTYNFFDSSLGNLTGVEWQLTSISFATVDASFSANLNTISFSASLNDTASFLGNPFNASATFDQAGSAPFIGVGTFGAGLVLTVACNENCSGEGWSGNLSLTYTYDPASQNAVPLPAALPLFASGAAGLGLLAWRKRRKKKAKEA